MRKILIVLVLIFTVFALCASCRTVKPSQSLEARSGSAQHRWNLALFENPDGTGTRFELTGALLGSGRLQGSARALPEGGWQLQAETLRWFTNWAEGWTEAGFVMSGEMLIARDGELWRLSVPTAVVWEYPESATIRYRDTILYGEPALSVFRRRWDRVSAVVPLLQSALGEDEYPLYKAKKRAQRGSSFFAQAGRFLLPEVYGLPSGGKLPRPLPIDRSRAEGRIWNRAYSREFFPESLREIRDTGTVYRDWEESAELFFALYNRDALAAERSVEVLIENTNEENIQ